MHRVLLALMSLGLASCSLLLSENAPGGDGDSDAAVDAPLNDALDPPICPDVSDCQCRVFDNPDAACGAGVCDVRNNVCIPETEVVFVASDGAPAPGCGHENQSPCRSIAGGIERAINSNRFVVHVRAGDSFSESLIPAETVDKTRVLGFGATLRADSGVGFEVRAGRSFSLEGISIVGGVANPAPGVKLVSEGELELYRVEVSGHEEQGVAVTGNSAPNQTFVKIESSKVTGNLLVGVAVTNAHYEIRNTEISGNSGAGFSAGVAAVDQAIVFQFNTVINNGGVAVCGLTPSFEELLGNILDDGVVSCPDFGYSWLNGNTDGSNLNERPVFRDEMAGDYRLGPQSPGTNVSELDAAMRPGDVDPTGRPRRLEGAYDVGAYDYDASLP